MTPNSLDRSSIHPDRSHREIGPLLKVESDHLPVVHLIDMISGEDKDVVRLLIL